MIWKRMKAFIEEVDQAFVASTDADGQPHLAAGRGLRVPDSTHLVFEAWLCRKTLSNVAGNPRVALAIIDHSSGHGYQFSGVVEKTSAVAILNGYAPRMEEPGLPQVRSRMVVRIEEVLEFSPGAHTDHPLTPEA